VSHDTAFNIVTDPKKVRGYDGVATLLASNMRHAVAASAPFPKFVVRRGNL